MRKEENKTTGELGLFFTKDDIKKIKYAGAGIGAVLLLLVGTSIYSIYSMTSLQAQNELYRNQMKLAEQRMDDLVRKSQTVDKLSEQMQNMVNGNLSQTPATQNSLQNGRCQYRTGCSGQCGRGQPGFLPGAHSGAAAQ